MDYNEMIMRHSFGDVADEYLCHHGIKGQRWGIRRYQNEDGSLTAAGKARYITDDGHLTDAGRKKYAKDIKKLAKLKERANVNAQMQKIKKYDALNEGARKVAKTAALTSLAAKGSSKLLVAAALHTNKKADAVYDTWDKATSKIINDGYDKMYKIDDLYRKKGVISRAQRSSRLYKLQSDTNKLFDASDAAYNKSMAPIKMARKGIIAADTIRKGIQIGGAAVAVGAGATYAYSLYQSRLARKRVTEIGHQQAVADVKKHMDYMKQAYGNVKLDDLYKKDSK